MAIDPRTAGTASEGFRAWLRRALDPADSLCEVTCGLVMTLTILLTASFYVEGSSNPAQVLVGAAIGCNLAWGLIDGLLYVMSDLYERSGRQRFLRDLRTADVPTGRAMVRARAEASFGSLLDDAETDDLADAAYAKALGTEPHTIRLRDLSWSAVAASVALNMLAIVPAVIPFIVVDDWRTALRISTFLLVLTLAGVGWGWGHAAHLRAWRTSATMVGIGLVMVSVAVVLGG
jgi:VIT1/CCC1 family predicted Fe2+/Mn2+ transporter